MPAETTSRKAASPKLIRLDNITSTPVTDWSMTQDLLPRSIRALYVTIISDVAMIPVE